MAAASRSWLLLAYQLPSRPSNARVATWRRLQRVGAVQVHGSGYVLPSTAETREDLEWIAEEIVGQGGQATLFVAATAEARAGDEIVDAFRRARAGEYEEIRAAAESKAKAGTRAERESLAGKLRERLAAVRAIDFFAAPGQDEAEEAVAKLQRNEEDAMARTQPGGKGEAPLAARDYRDRDWVTRPRPGIDRMSTAWLVRRFIDPEATFRFVAADRRAELPPTAVPFDMSGVELGHQGSGCTFETVARRFGIADPTVAWLGRIVHQLDLKTEEAAIPEAAVVGHLVEGLRRIYADDHQLLEQGIVMFEALYRSESERQPRRQR
jgi:hypothetical protein